MTHKPDARGCIHHTRLESGLEISVDPAPGAHTLAIEVGIRAGSCDERDAPHGTAHFLEHMLFKGSQKRTAEEISAAITDAGGMINASTDWDTTSVSCVTLPEQLHTALDVIGDMIVNPALRTDDIENERKVILQELEQRNGTWATLEECFYASAYGEQDLSRPIIGTEDGIKAITPQSLRSFAARNYVSGNIVVAIAGDVDPAEATAAVAHAFSRLPQGARSPMPAFTYHGGEQGFACSCERGIVKYGFESPAVTHPDSYAIALFRNIVGYGPSSRLYQELRERRGLVYDVSADRVHHCGRSLTVFETQGHATKIREILFALHDCLMEAADGITQEELDKAKIQVIAWDRMQRDSMTSRVQRAVFDLISEGRVHQPLAEIDQFAAVELDALRRCAKEMLASQPTLAVHGPARGMPKLQNLKGRTTRQAA